MAGYLIVGQGIAGSLLSWMFWKESIPCKVIDASDMPSSTEAAAGLVNPITGKFLALSWEYDVLQPYAHDIYERFLRDLGRDDVLEKPLVRALKDEKMQNEWTYRSDQERYKQFMEKFEWPNSWSSLLHKPMGVGLALRSMQVPISEIKTAWSLKLKAYGLLEQQAFNFSDLEIQKGNSGAVYNGVHYDGVIFCEGSHVMKNPFFHYLPFDPAKGEVFLMRLPGWDGKYIFKNQLFIAPWVEEDVYWVGSSYEWKTDDWQPSEEKGSWVLAQFKAMYKGSYEILAHKAGIRPAVKDRKPILGAHPDYPALFILNGLGTKGTSLGPYCANQLLLHLTSHREIRPEISIRRFDHLYARG